MLDLLVVSLLRGPAELDLRDHLDPWGWNAMAALARLTPEGSPARLLLTGRRAGTARPPELATGLASVLFDPTEAAAQTPAPALKAWETTELEVAMAELGVEARRGRGVFAHCG